MGLHHRTRPLQERPGERYQRAHMTTIDGIEIRILCEYGSGDSFERRVHEFTTEGYDKRWPKVLEVANWPISEEERKAIL